ncbi:MAG TPA: hypothetical protein VFT13_14025 [Candidatus Krumholzibacteria bacterium]|nr:hypothetical protein [Candidatus Krumholzibacteria bacterium]
MTRRQPTDRPLQWFLALVVVSFAVGAPALHGPYYADDFQFVFDPPHLDPFYHFSHENPHNPFYRPIQSALLAAVQSGFGLSTWPIHAGSIVLHALLGFLVFRMVSGLGLGRGEARLASLLVVASQAAVPAVAGNDTLSQLLGTLAGYLSLWWFYRWARGEKVSARGIGDRRYLGALAMLAVALFAKETGVAFVLLAALVLLTGLPAPRGPVPGMRARAARLVPIGVVFVLYLAARSAGASAVPEMGENRYGFALGLNIPRNLAMLWTAATIPFSSVTMFTAVATGDRMTLAGLGAAYAVLLSLVAVGLWRRRREARVWWQAGVGLLSVATIVPIKQVSELYAYQLLPAAAALLAVGLVSAGQAARQRKPWRILWMVAVASLVAGNAVASFSKAGMMHACGTRAAVLLDQIAPLAREAPAGGELVLVNPPAEGPAYSTFRVPGFGVLRHAEHYVARRAGREDITVRIASGDDGDAGPAPGRVVLGLDGDRVRRYDLSGP